MDETSHGMALYCGGMGRHMEAPKSSKVGHLSGKLLVLGQAKFEKHPKPIVTGLSGLLCDFWWKLDCFGVLLEHAGVFPIFPILTFSVVHAAV